ncbi:AEC family transporter [Arenivirga flava]|uniref:Membrane protein n=1 Tax=Arenivirga flava TaxID=1930060 RepID=A0AA37XBW6_9MICO|nr:AEC family transporter [Arenivirga flava]GMA28830.1 membrane protein [Arenivirga flava]
MIGVLTGFAIIGTIILVGYIIARTGVAGDHAQFVMNRVAFFVSTPALLFVTMAQADLRVVFSSFLLIAVISALGICLVYAAIAVFLLKRRIVETTVGAMAAGYVNSNNIGLPVAIYVIGDAQYVAPILLFQLVIGTPIVLTILDLATNPKGGRGLRNLARPFGNPIIIASVLGVGLAFFYDRIPTDVITPILQPFALIGGSAIPLVLMAFGMSLRGNKPLRAGSGRKDVAIASFLKAFVMPAFTWVLAYFVFGLRDQQLFAAVTMSALPSAQNVYNYAARYNAGLVVARDTVLVTTVVSLPVLLLVAFLLGGH